MITITNRLSIEEDEIEEVFIRASGPGGQNVNKVATAVQLRFDIRHSPSLPEDVRAHAERLAGRRLTKDGVVVISASRFRTQEQNRADALERLVDLLRRATETPRPRKATRPTKASKVKRIEQKQHRGKIKKLRGAYRNGEG